MEKIYLTVIVVGFLAFLRVITKRKKQQKGDSSHEKIQKERETLMRFGKNGKGSEPSYIPDSY